MAFCQRQRKELKLKETRFFRTAFLFVFLTFFNNIGFAESTKDTSSTDEQNEVVWIGALSHDLVLIPLIRFKSGQWSSPWTAHQKVQLKASSEERDFGTVPSEWLGGDKKILTYWNLDTIETGSKQFQVVGLKKPNWTCAFWGLKTSLNENLLPRRA